MILISDIRDLSRYIFFNKLKYFITDSQIGIHWENLRKQNKNRSLIEKVMFILSMGMD